MVVLSGNVIQGNQIKGTYKGTSKGRFMHSAGVISCDSEVSSISNDNDIKLETIQT
jgi:hypothetical protein